MSEFETNSPAKAKKGGRWGLLGTVVGGVGSVVGGVGNIVGSAASAVVGGAEESDGDEEDEDFNEEDDLDTVVSSDDEGDTGDDNGEKSDSVEDTFKDVNGDGEGEDNKKMRKVDITRKSHMRLDPTENIPIAGSTMEWRRHDGLNEVLDDSLRHVWGKGTHSNFNLRVGPNYKKTGAKEPSGPALYDVMGMDVFYSSERIKDVGSKVKFPDEWTNIETNHPDVPPMFVVNGQLPEVSVGSTVGSLFVDKSDGPGWNYVIYYRLSEHAATQLKDPATATPAVKYLLDYLQRAPLDDNYTESSSEFFGRFKIIPIVDNLDTLNLPGFINSYNAKPALIARCGKISKGEKYWGFDANTHAFGAAARSAIGIIDISTMVMQWGQCLEARDDDEMPEALLGCLNIVKNAPEMAVVWQDWGSEGKARNQTLGCQRKRQQRRAAERKSSPSKSPQKVADDSDED